MAITLIVAFVVVNIAIILIAYHTFLKKLSPTQGYLSLALLIALLAVSNVFIYDSVLNKITKPTVEIQGELCSKEYVQTILNKLSQQDIKLDKAQLKEQLIACFDDEKQTILVRQVMESGGQGQVISVTSNPTKIVLSQYIEGLSLLSLNDSIHVDLIEHASTGKVMYLEISERQKKK
jgi:hypothetical protein